MLKNLEKGAQTINLGTGCVVEHIILHEMLHSLGLVHEHNRPNRDEHVTVNFQNLIPNFHAQFYKMSESEWLDQSIPYNKFSLMHFPADAFLTPVRGYILHYMEFSTSFITLF